MKVLQDVYPRRDGLSERDVCLRIGGSADTLTDVLLIPKEEAERERLHQEEEDEDASDGASDLGNAGKTWAVPNLARSTAIEKHCNAI